jgi:PadR family transcriptional regulator PadR
MTFADNELTDKKFQKELNSGTAALVLLAVLDRAQEPMYGYQIAKHLDTGSEEVPVKQGALYPVLRALEAGGLLESQVEPSVTGPPRRYYQITSNGRDTLRQWVEIWNRTKTFVESTLKGNRHD